MIDARHGQDVQDDVGARDEQHREEVEDKACKAVGHPASALENFKEISWITRLFYLSVTHGQARDKAAGVNTQGKHNNDRGHTESVSRVAGEIET